MQFNTNFLPFSFINSTKKSKTKTKRLFEGDDDANSSTQPHMKELLGLCSGRFSDNEDTGTLKDSDSNTERKKQAKKAIFDTQETNGNMNELLDLCSGRFTDDENDLGADNVEEKENDSESELDEEENKGPSDVGDENEDDKMVEKSDVEDESDLEELMIKRKYGKKYETKKKR